MLLNALSTGTSAWIFIWQHLVSIELSKFLYRNKNKLSGISLNIFLFAFSIVFGVGSVLLIFLVFCVVFFVLFVFVLCLVYTTLPVALDCQFLITPSVFSNVYFDFWGLSEEWLFPCLLLSIITVKSFIFNNHELQETYWIKRVLKSGTDRFYLRNKSWKSECVGSFNMGWRILVFYPEPQARDKIY